MRTAMQKASRYVLQCQTMTKTKQNPTWHLSVHGPNMFPIPIARHVSFTDATRRVQVHFDAKFYASSEDGVSSRPAKSLTPSPVAAPE